MKDKAKVTPRRKTTFVSNGNHDNNNRNSFFDFYTESIPLIENFSKPIFLLVLILMFWTPLKQIVESIPTLLDRTSKVTLGDIAVEIERSIITNPPAKFRPYITGLSTDAISFLIIDGREDNYSEGYWCETTKDDIYGFKPGIKELENRGLVSINQKERNTCLMWYWSLTDIGKEVYIYIRDSYIEELLRSWESPNDK